MTVKSAAVDASSRRRNCLVPLGVVLIGANLRVPITTLGPGLTDIQSDLGLSDFAAGLLSSLPLIVFAALSLVAPAVGRKLGAERGLGAALFAILIGTVIRSCPFPAALWVGTLLVSAAIAIANVLLPGLVKREFPDRAAALIGIYAAAMATFAGLGAGLAAPVAQLHGSSWRVSIALPAVLAILAIAIWAPQLSGTQHKLTSIASSSDRHPSPWRHPIGWQVSAFFAFHSFVFYSLVSWYSAIAGSQGESATSAGVDLLLYQVVAVATNLGAAPLIKRMKDQRGIGVLCGGLLLVGRIGLSMSAPHPTVWLMIAGLGAGFSMTTSLSLFALRSTHHEQASKLSGMAQFIGYAGAAMGPLIFGALHQATGGWTFSLWTLISASLLVTVFAFLSGRNRTMTL